MKHNRSWAPVVILAAAVFFLLPINVWAQGGTNPPPSVDQEGQQVRKDPQGADANQTPDIKPLVTPTPAYPVDAKIHAPGKALSWMGPEAPLHYGPLYLGNIDI